MSETSLVAPISTNTPKPEVTPVLDQADLEAINAFHEVFAQIDREIDVPEIEPLSPVEKAAGKLVSKTAEFVRENGQKLSRVFNFRYIIDGIRAFHPFDFIPDPDQGFVMTLKQAIVDKMSTWACYAVSNLVGRKKDIPKQAIRYTHFVETGTINNDAITPALIQAFTDPNCKMVWLDKDGQYTTDDPRLSSKHISFENVEDIDLTIGKIDVQSEHTNSPSVIHLNADQLDQPQVQTAIANVIDHHPFALVHIHQSNGSDILQFVVNHEYMDGVGCSYSLGQIVKNIGGVIPVLYDRSSRNQIATSLQIADKVEHTYADSENYQVKSAMLSEELVGKIDTLYDIVSQKCRDFNLGEINKTTFIQMLFLANMNVDGDNIVGGALKFCPNIDTQLGHYNAGDALEFFSAILAGNRQYLQDNGYLTEIPSGGRTKQILTIYRNGQNNIENVIAPIATYTPPDVAAFLNQFAVAVHGDAAIEGSCMVSIIPQRVRVGKRTLECAGYGGPACTEAQQAAITIGILDDGSIIVRRKYRRVKK